MSNTFINLLIDTCVYSLRENISIHKLSIDFNALRAKHCTINTHKLFKQNNLPHCFQKAIDFDALRAKHRTINTHKLFKQNNQPHCFQKHINKS